MGLGPLLDGLVLGGAQLAADGTLQLRERGALAPWLTDVHHVLAQHSVTARVSLTAPPRPRARLQAGPSPILEALHARWVAARGEDALPSAPLQLPKGLSLSAELLAAWYAGGGAATNGGYAVRLTARRLSWPDAQALAGALTGHFGWEVAVFDDHGPMLRLARSGDRRQFQQAVAPRLAELGCFAQRLNLAESAPCTEGEAARRRAPRRLTAEDREALLARAQAEPEATFDELAEPLGVSGRHVGRLLRKLGLHRRQQYRRLVLAEVQTILTELAAGAAQRQVARDHGISQAHVWYLLERQRARGKPPR